MVTEGEVNYGGSCCEKDIGYLDDYGVNSQDYGFPLIAGSIGAGTTVVGVGGALGAGALARRAQEERLKAEKIAREHEMMLERQRVARKNQRLLLAFPVGLILLAGFVRLRRKQ